MKKTIQDKVNDADLRAMKARSPLERNPEFEQRKSADSFKERIKKEGHPDRHKSSTFSPSYQKDPQETLVRNVTKDQEELKEYFANKKKKAIPLKTKETFAEAFAKNRKAGKKEFIWNGKRYTTELKEEETERKKKMAGSKAIPSGEGKTIKAIKPKEPSLTEQSMSLSKNKGTTAKSVKPEKGFYSPR
jgi:hypothetical protein